MSALNGYIKILKFPNIITLAQRRGIKLMIYFTLLEKKVTTLLILNNIKVYYSFSQFSSILIYLINFFSNINALLLRLLGVYSIINTLLLRLDQYLLFDNN